MSVSSSPSRASRETPHPRGSLEAWLAAELEFRALSDPLLSASDGEPGDLDEDEAVGLLRARGRADRRLADYLGPWLD